MNKKIFWLVGMTCSVALVSILSLGGYAANTDQVASKPSEERTQAILEAKSKAAHDALAAQYEKEAKEDQSKAQEHREMAKAYAKVGFLAEKHGLVRHCNNLAQRYEDAAKENLALAKTHRELAESAK